MSFANIIRRKRAIILLAAAAVIAATWVFLPAPALYESTSFSTVVYDRDGQLLRLNLARDQRYRLFEPLPRISDDVVQATLLYEDRYFFDHPGVNLAALVRAAWTTYVTRTRRIGASTLTMQLARMRFNLDTRTIRGKLVQISRAVQLERHYSKSQILEAYLNLAPYGGNIEGVGTAALVYFDKPASELTLAEALALAVIPQNPAQRAPTRAHKLPALYDARDRLFALWRAEYDPDDAQSALMTLPLQVRHPHQLPFHAPHYVVGASARLMPGNDSGDLAAAHTTNSTLSLPLQKDLQRTLSQYLERRASDGLKNASAMLVDTRSMHVLASIGSANYFDAGISGQVNGVSAKRSPGSTLKPFVFGLAMDQGLIHPMSLLTDAPKRFGVYTPENFDRGFMGPIVARDALIYSRNVPAIDLLNRVGQEAFYTFLADAGVTGMKPADHYGLAMILGGNELTMQELIRLYAMLANGGRLRDLVWDRSPVTQTAPVRLMSPEASFLVLDILRQNPRPDALLVGTSLNDRPVAWKTGTSYAYRDAWTVGVTGPYALAVWVGNFDGSSNPALIGRQAAAPLFFDLIDTMLASATVSNDIHAAALATAPDAVTEPLNLQRVDVCAGTGDLPGRYCPGTESGWFIPGVSPIKVSSVHRPVHVDTRTGLRACHGGAPHTRREVFEFWPSDIVRLFRQAGISVRQPPPYASACAQGTLAARGMAPTITSPAPRLSYMLQPHRKEPDQLPLTATTDADVTSLFWFVDDQFIAEAGRDEALLWTPAPGDHHIQVVDDLGRSNSQMYRFEVAQ